MALNTINPTETVSWKKLQQHYSEMQKISIDPSLLKPEDREILEDLIIAAYNDAKAKADQESKSSMTGAFGNFGGLPGMNLPF